MTYTEEEAKEKWCPFKPIVTEENRTHRCIASDCMAWRWIYPLRKGETEKDRASLDIGYCGLAGKVE